MQDVIQIKNGIIINVNVSAKSVWKYTCNCSTCICEISRYLKSIVDDLVIMCDEIVSVADIVSAIVTNVSAESILCAENVVGIVARVFVRLVSI